MPCQTLQHHITHHKNVKKKRGYMVCSSINVHDEHHSRLCIAHMLQTSDTIHVQGRRRDSDCQVLDST
jgi:hypothetical protein